MKNESNFTEVEIQNILDESDCVNDSMSLASEFKVKNSFSENPSQSLSKFNQLFSREKN